jgi:hypothetical protein
VPVGTPALVNSGLAPLAVESGWPAEAPEDKVLMVLAVATSVSETIVPYVLEDSTTEIPDVSSGIDEDSDTVRDSVRVRVS